MLTDAKSRVAMGALCNPLHGSRTVTPSYASCGVSLFFAGTTYPLSLAAASIWQKTVIVCPLERM